MVDSRPVNMDIRITKKWHLLQSSSLIQPSAIERECGPHYFRSTRTTLIWRPAFPSDSQATMARPSP